MARKGPSTIGAATFNPEDLLTNVESHSKTRAGLNENNLRSAIISAFNLPKADKYTYHATASVNLDQVQEAINAGTAHGLQAWYGVHTETDSEGKEQQVIHYPTPADVSAYIGLFDPSKSAGNILKGFKANAKKGSLRAKVADHLVEKRYLDQSVVVPKTKKGHPNVYADFWTWCCFSLKWAGPEPNTVNVKLSHHVLPVFMHHFSCVCPSYESLEIIKFVSNGKLILDIGSGNGYWTYMLRRHGCEVKAIDNGQSTWRTIWISDTFVADGVKYLKKRPGAGENDVLLLVYPVVGLEFTMGVLDAYKGDVVCVAGTQNGNGYTAFKDEPFDSWMKRERPDFEKLVQIPLPSFPGKDDALFVFKRKTTLNTSPN